MWINLQINGPMTDGEMLESLDKADHLLNDTDSGEESVDDDDFESDAED